MIELTEHQRARLEGALARAHDADLPIIVLRACGTIDDRAYEEERYVSRRAIKAANIPTMLELEASDIIDRVARAMTSATSYVPDAAYPILRRTVILYAAAKT